MTELEGLMDEIRTFRDERDWAQFHTVRNLIGSISIEAGELLEITQWKSEEAVESLANDPEARRALEHEAADILIYLLLLSDRAKFDLLAAAKQKIAMNRGKYPVAKSRGKATKYTDL